MPSVSTPPRPCVDNNESAHHPRQAHDLMSKLKKDMVNAAADISQGIANKNLWLALGWNDVKNRYNRSKIGVFWASLSLLILVAALGPVYSRLMAVELREYALHLLLGFVIWNYVSGILTESAREFVSSSNYLISFQLSYFTLLLRVVWRNLVVLGYQMLVFLLFAIALRQPVTIAWTMAPLAIMLITLTALWMALLISVFATRFRDLDELLNNVLRLVFFVTPIIWMPHLNSELALIADLNPFYHLIEIFREPLLNGNIVERNWTISIILALSGWLIAFPLFARFRSRIAFWL